MQQTLARLSIEKTNGKPFIGLFLVYIYICCVFTPYVMHYYLIFPALVGAFFLLIEFPKIFFIVNKNRICIIAIIFFLLDLFYKGVGISQASFGNYVHRFIQLISIIMSMYVLEICSNKEIRKLVFFTFIVLLINMISNMIMWNTFANVDQVMLLNYEEIYGRVNLGRADWQYSLMIAAMSLLCVTSYNYIEGFKFKSSLSLSVLSSVLWILILLYFIKYATSTTMLVSFAISIFFIIIAKKTRDKKIFVVEILLGGLLLFFSIYFIDFLIEKFLNCVDGVMSEKFMDRMNYLLYSKQNPDGTSLSRIEMIKIDLESWLKSPTTFLFGNGLNIVDLGDVLTNAKVTGAGNHSTFFDMLSRYGVFGFTLFVVFLKESFSYLKAFCSGVNSFVNLVIVFLILIFNLIFNMLQHGNVLFVFFLLVPFGLSNGILIKKDEVEVSYVRK